MSSPEQTVQASQTIQAVYDLKRLFTLRESVQTFDPSAPPSVRLLAPSPPDSSVGPFSRVGILCGSFNPLTRAHTELAGQVCKAWYLDQVFLSLAKVTVDKEQLSGMSLEDRLLLLSLYAERHPNISIALVNRGLYVEQAQAFRAVCGAHTQLFFLTGMDKLLQILDARYYQDRDAALDELFGLAELIVANRGAFSHTEFTHLLEQPENQTFRPAIHFFPLTDVSPAPDSSQDSSDLSSPLRNLHNLNDLSATAMRDVLATGVAGASGASIAEHVPPETVQFVSEAQVYRPPLSLSQSGEAIDVYSIRVALIEVLYSVRSWVEHAEHQVDFRHVLQHALADDPTGYALRHARPTLPRHKIIALLRSCLD
jgi:nicotinic acid mononucleotide adenylyltransferase